MSSSNNLSKHNQFWCNVERALADGDGGLFFSLALLGVVCLATISAVLAVSFIHLGVIPTVGIVFILALIKVMHVGLSNK